MAAAVPPFPPPPRTKTFSAEALEKYRLTRALYEATPALGALLAELRGGDARELKCYASLKGSELQLHVADITNVRSGSDCCQVVLGLVLWRRK